MNNEITQADNTVNEPKRNYKLPVMLLDAFTMIWCIDRTEEELTFMCKQCPFEQGEKCAVKTFKCIYAPDYKDFGSMGDL